MALGRPQAPDHSTGRPAAPKTPPAPPPRRGQGLSSSSGFPARGSGVPGPPGLHALRERRREDGLPPAAGAQPRWAPWGRRETAPPGAKEEGCEQDRTLPAGGGSPGLCVLSPPGGGSPEHPPGLGTGHMEPRVT